MDADPTFHTCSPEHPRLLADLIAAGVAATTTLAAIVTTFATVGVR